MRIAEMLGFNWNWTNLETFRCPCSLLLWFFALQWCWWLYDGDWFQMLVAESLSWRLFSLCWWFSQCIKSVTNILSQSVTVTNISIFSPTHLVSNICHQHRWNLCYNKLKISCANQNILGFTDSVYSQLNRIDVTRFLW